MTHQWDSECVFSVKYLLRFRLNYGYINVLNQVECTLDKFIKMFILL